MRFLSRPFPSALRRISAVLALSAVLSPAFALPLTDMRAEDYVPMASELKKSLNLNANQQTLWQQIDSKTRKLLFDRKARRERLQAEALKAVQKPGVELRDLNKALDEETSISANEERQLREWWLTMNDSLSESQRLVVAQMIAEQLERVSENGAARPERKDDGDHKGGGKGGKGGMGGGMGMGVGPGGVNVNLPGGGGD